MEIWKPVPSFPGYEASNFGKIRNEKSKRNLKSSLKKTGYLAISLQKEGYGNSGKSESAHRIVTSAFLGECPKGFQVNHKDGNKVNNTIENLEYLSASENAFHAVRLGLRASGSKHWKSKLDEFDILIIRDLHIAGFTHVKIAKIFNVTPTSICRIIRGRSWKHV